MTTIRQQRVQELLFQELSILIGNELEDPQLSLMTVTNVVVSRDLRNAKIYVYNDESETSRRVVLRHLNKATPFIRRQLAQRLTLRVVPELTFHYDDTPERAARVDELIQLIRSERGEDVSGAATTPPAVDTPATPSQTEDKEE
ncbi:MAG: 30S ribosome-binding factor RbfA [Caldilineaceae bacterium]|nr:30S ribosome-binding factor RbfA [Caldilineaceae bacterium]